MADGSGGLNVEIGATITNLVRQLAKSVDVADKTAKKIERNFAENNKRAADSFGLIAGGAKKAESSLQNFGKGAFTELNQSVTTLQQRINSVTGIGPEVANSARASAAAFEAFDQSAASVDNLRASIDPLFAASQRYEKALQTLDAALEQGVISQRQYATLNDQLATSYLRNSGAVSGFAGRLQGLGLNSAQARQGLQQVGFQVQDFAVQVGAGTSATQAFAQQFPQLASAFGPVGTAIGTLAAIGIPLLVAAYAAAGTEADALTDILSRQEDALKGVADETARLVLERQRLNSGAESDAEQKLINQINDLLAERKRIADELAASYDNITRAAGIGAQTVAAAKQEELRAALAVNDAKIEELRNERDAIALRKTGIQLAETFRKVQAAIADADISGPWRNVLGFMDAALAKAQQVAATVNQTQIGGGRGAGPGGPLVGSTELAELQAGGGVFRNIPEPSIGRGGGAGGGGGGGGGGASELEREVERRAEALKEFLEQGQEQIAQLELEQSLLGKTAEQALFLTTQYELLQAAKEKGLELDQQIGETGETLRQHIDAQAEAVTNLTMAYEAAQEKAEFFKDITDDLKAGLIDSIVSGQDFRGVLEDIAKSLAKAALQAALFGQGPLASLFGGNMVGTGLLSGIPGFSEGGFTGAGGTFQPKGVVHGGEYVFSKAAVNRIGVGNLEAMHRQLKGYAGGGVVGNAAPMAASAAPRVEVVVIDSQEKFGEYLASNPRAERDIMNIVKRNGG